jgi:hypothetical protein
MRVVMLSVVMLNVANKPLTECIMPNVVVLNIVMSSVVAPFKILQVFRNFYMQLIS